MNKVNDSTLSAAVFASLYLAVKYCSADLSGRFALPKVMCGEKRPSGTLSPAWRASASSTCFFRANRGADSPTPAQTTACGGVVEIAEAFHLEREGIP